MSTFVNSIVRGAGFTIGRNLVGDFGKSKSVKTTHSKSSDLRCYSHEGYSEGDVEITYTRDFTKDYIPWYLYPVAFIISAIPYLGLLMYLRFIYLIFVKKHKMFFWEYKWVTHTISDKRTKSGIREVQILEKDITRIEKHKPTLRNKIEMLLVLLVSIYFTYYYDWSTFINHN